MTTATTTRRPGRPKAEHPRERIGGLRLPAEMVEFLKSQDNQSRWIEKRIKTSPEFRQFMRDKKG